MIDEPFSGLRDQRVLVIDDDAYTCRMLETVFARAGATVKTTMAAKDGLQLLRTLQPNLIILDILMPDMNGWEAMRQIDCFGPIPTIMVITLSNEDAIVRGLEAGALDYVTKPFSPAVLLARARAALRLGNHASPAVIPAGYRDHRLSIDLLTRRVRVADRPVRLTKTEYRLLATLVQNAGRLLSVDWLLSHVWPAGDVENACAVHTCVFRLRQKLEEDPGNPRLLLNEHGMGYRFEADPAGLEYRSNPSLS